jgi:hypothetical protein
VYGRYTQAFSSVVPPTTLKYPLHVPHRLAKFVWTDRADGGKDLKLYSPPGSASPVITVTGLYKFPFICIPNDIYSAFLPQSFQTGLTTFLQSVTDSYDPVGPITGHVLGSLRTASQGCTSAAFYGSIEAVKPVSLDGGFFNVGLYFPRVGYNLTAQPYPAT